MIKTTFEHLGRLATQQAVQKLANSTFKTPAAFRVKAITKSVRDGFFKMRDDYKTQIEEKFAVKNEKGQFTPPDEGSKAAELGLPFKCKEGMEGDVKGALDTYNKTEFKLDQKKLSAEMLFEVNEWSPRELEALEFLVEEPTGA